MGSFSRAVSVWATVWSSTRGMEAGNSWGPKKRDTPARKNDDEAEGIRGWSGAKRNQRVEYPAFFKLLSSVGPRLCQ